MGICPLVEYEVSNTMDEKDFAIRLSKLRTKKNISAREMSLSIGQNPGYINHIETGQGTPSLPAVFYICDYLGITPSEFFDIETENPAKIHSINHYLKKLSDEQLETIEKLVKDLAKKDKT